jgi:hypothetical protein
MLSAVIKPFMLSVIILSVIILSVIILSVVMLSDVTPIIVHVRKYDTRM